MLYVHFAHTTYSIPLTFLQWSHYSVVPHRCKAACCVQKPWQCLSSGLTHDTLRPL
jgi:hypothetical protein